MKRISFIITSLLIGSMIMTGCSKDESPASGGGDNPQPSDPYDYYYEITNTNGTVTADTFIKYNITYYTSQTDSVMLENVTLPWQSEHIEIDDILHFKAILSAQAVYSEEDIPTEPFYAGIKYTIYENSQVMSSGSKFVPMNSKDEFLTYVAEHPQALFLKFRDVYGIIINK